MQPTKELIDSIYREKVDRARRRSAAEKFADGLELFDFSCRLMADGIRMQHPEADEAEVRRLMTKRFEIARRLEDVH